MVRLSCNTQWLIVMLQLKLDVHIRFLARRGGEISPFFKFFLEFYSDVVITVIINHKMLRPSNQPPLSLAEVL